MRPSYSRAIKWIADNDETAETEVARMADLISVMLVADLFGKQPADVARDVLANRRT